MENSSFVPNPLSSPALMVLASTAEGRDVSRLPGPPHPFSGQSLDKDGIPPPPFSTAGFVYRPGDPFSSPIYAPMPPFVRPNLERTIGLIGPGSGAFRPLGGPHEGVEAYHSAFTPAKKPKLEDVSCTSTFSSADGRDQNYGDKDGEGSRRSLSPTIKEERPSSISSTGGDTNSEIHSDAGDSYDRGTPDSEGRSLRKQRKRCALDGQTPCCPVCGLTLRSGELEAHLSMEIDKLERICRGGRKSRDSTPQGRKSLPSPSVRKGKDSPSPEAASKSRYETYLRIRCNRQSRLNARSRNKKRRVGEENMKETVCPICSERLTGTPEELNGHVEVCLKKQRNEGEEEAVDVEGDAEGEQYEEYTWAGQTRIRATTLLEGGFAASGFQTSKKASEDDGDLNVDGDDSEEYGKPQFSENDLMPVSSDEPAEERERQALRGALLGFTNRTGRGDLSQSTCGAVTCDACDDLGGSDSVTTSSPEALVMALKTRLKELENCRENKQKCLICMDHYKTPLTSIQCWHVHCQECWFRTLGAKKLCPQCNMITSPSDLRRIFL